MIGRWTAIDPADYIGSPYKAMGNNSISNYDVRGDTINVYSNSDIKFNGPVLFTLNNGAGQQKLSTRQTYLAGWQWTTPDGDNYAPIITVNKIALAKLGTKFFTVADLIEFSISRVASKDGMKEHGGGKSADWKASPDGANGAYLVFVDSKLYWADFVGNIPFGYNMARFGFTKSKTGTTGDNFAKGYYNPFGQDGPPDRDAIMRGYLLQSRGRNIHRSVRGSDVTDFYK